MERYRKPYTEKDEKYANEILNIVNDMSFDSAGVAKAMQILGHRTLQQSFTRLAFEWLKDCAADDYLYDERNKASHLLAKSLLEGKQDLPALPFV